jgi:hypothetical protein
MVGVTAASFLMTMPPTLAAEVTTVEGDGCPFSFEIAHARSLYQGSATTDTGFTVNWSPSPTMRRLRATTRRLGTLGDATCPAKPDHVRDKESAGEGKF